MSDPLAWQTLLVGPFGGYIAIAFGAGCGTGYGFAVRTVVKIANRRIDELRTEITGLTTRLQIVEDRAYHGMERQAAQVRQSSVEIIRRTDPDRDILDKMGGQP